LRPSTCHNRRTCQRSRAGYAGGAADRPARCDRPACNRRCRGNARDRAECAFVDNAEVVRPVRSDCHAGRCSGRARIERDVARRSVDVLAAARYGEDSTTVIDDVDVLSRRRLASAGNHFQSPLHRGILFNRFLSLAVSTTCRQYSIRFSATVLFAEKPARFAKTLIECASEPSIRKYLRSSYGIRSPDSDSGPGSGEAKSHPESSHGFLPADPEFAF